MITKNTFAHWSYWSFRGRYLTIVITSLSSSNPICLMTAWLKAISCSARPGTLQTRARKKSKRYPQKLSDFTTVKNVPVEMELLIPSPLKRNYYICAEVEGRVPHGCASVSLLWELRDIALLITAIEKERLPCVDCLKNDHMDINQTLKVVVMLLNPY